MTDSIYLLRSDGPLTMVQQAPYEHESDLQKLLDQHPELIPGAQINPEAPRRWLLVRSEAGIPSEEGGSDWWSLDHLLLDQDGVPTFVEVKRSSDTRIRREVVAQMLEYAANGTAFWHVERFRTWIEEMDTEGTEATARIEEFIADHEQTADQFWTRVEANLRASRVRLIFVADVIPPTLRRLVEFLNEHLDTVEVLAVEIPQYASAGDDGVRALVPRLIGQTERARAAKGNSPSSPTRDTDWLPSEVLEGVKQHTPEQFDVAQRVIDWADGRPEISTRGGRGVAYPSVLFSVDTMRPRSPNRTILMLYGGESPALELRLRRMINTHPYRRAAEQAQLYKDIQQLGIRRLMGGQDILQHRPNVALSELDRPKLDGLLDIIDRWIKDVRNAASAPGADDAEE